MGWIKANATDKIEATSIVIRQEKTLYPNRLASDIPLMITAVMRNLMSQPRTFEEVIDFLRNYDNPSQHDTVEIARILARIAGNSNFDQLRDDLGEWLLDHERS